MGGNKFVPFDRIAGEHRIIGQASARVPDHNAADALGAVADVAAAREAIAELSALVSDGVLSGDQAAAILGGTASIFGPRRPGETSIFGPRRPGEIGSQLDDSLGIAIVSGSGRAGPLPQRGAHGLDGGPDWSGTGPSFGLDPFSLVSDAGGEKIFDPDQARWQRSQPSVANLKEKDELDKLATTYWESSKNETEKMRRLGALDETAEQVLAQASAPVSYQPAGQLPERTGAGHSGGSGGGGDAPVVVEPPPNPYDDTPIIEPPPNPYEPGDPDSGGTGAAALAALLLARIPGVAAQFAPRRKSTTFGPGKNPGPSGWDPSGPGSALPLIRGWYDPDPNASSAHGDPAATRHMIVTGPGPGRDPGRDPSLRAAVASALAAGLLGGLAPASTGTSVPYTRPRK